MSFAIPRPPLVIGLLGLLPFLYGAAAAYYPFIEIEYAPPVLLVEVFGPVVFAYMSGVFWGFATAANRASGRAGWRWIGLAVLPAFFLFIAQFSAPGETLSFLLFGFPALLIIDVLFARAKMTPKWWLTLRFFLTIVATGAIWLIGEGAGYAL